MACSMLSANSSTEPMMTSTATEVRWSVLRVSITEYFLILSLNFRGNTEPESSVKIIMIKMLKIHRGIERKYDSCWCYARKLLWDARERWFKLKQTEGSK